jgi:hypothetical protein
VSKATNSDGFEWDELWAGYLCQPEFIQQAWIEELSKEHNLPKVMKQTPKVQTEVFENAPDSIKIMFGYGSVKPVVSGHSFDISRLDLHDQNTIEYMKIFADYLP